MDRNSLRYPYFNPTSKWKANKYKKKEEIVVIERKRDKQKQIDSTVQTLYNIFTDGKLFTDVQNFGKKITAQVLYCLYVKRPLYKKTWDNNNIANIEKIK